MIVITTPTGNIGSKVLQSLLKTDEKLRVIVRDASKLPAGVSAKVEVVEGSLDDAAAVARAYEGADELFFIIPPSMQFNDVNEYYLNFGNITCGAIKQQGVKRVVYVSGTGLGHEKNAGAVSASALAEELLEKTGAATRTLHCGTFMENLLHSIQPIKYTGQYGTPVPADTKHPWVATQDIADAAVHLLLDKTWAGTGSAGVLGPEDISYADITKIMNEVLDKDITYRETPPEEIKDTVMKYGATDAAAQSLVDIYLSVKNGTFNMVGRTPQNTSPTTFSVWCEEVFKPAFLK